MNVKYWCWLFWFEFAGGLGKNKQKYCRNFYKKNLEYSNKSRSTFNTCLNFESSR